MLFLLGWGWGKCGAVRRILCGIFPIPRRKIPFGNEMLVTESDIILQTYSPQ